MTKIEKILLMVLYGAQDSNIRFADIKLLLVHFGFNERIKVDHHIYTKTGVAEIIYIQPIGNKAKAYQVKQIRNIILKYRIGGDINV